MDDWQVLIQEHHPGYIGWARVPGQPGPAGGQPHRHRGPAAPGGHRAVPGHHRLRQLRPPDDRALPPRRARGLRVPFPGRTAGPPAPAGRSRAARSTTAVVTRLLAALTPARSSWRSPPPTGSPTDRGRVRAAELAVERARYEADRAERAFTAAEPENRLVTRTLESRWEVKLAALADAEGRLSATRNAAAAAAGPGRPGSTGRRPARPVRRRLDHPQGPQTAAAHPHRRRHPAPGTRQAHRPDRDQLAHRRHRGDHPPRAHPGTAKRSPPPAAELIRRIGPSTSNADLVAR